MFFSLDSKIRPGKTDISLMNGAKDKYMHWRPFLKKTQAFREWFISWNRTRLCKWSHRLRSSFDLELVFWPSRVPCDTSVEIGKTHGNKTFGWCATTIYMSKTTTLFLIIIYKYTVMFLACNNMIYTKLFKSALCLFSYCQRVFVLRK